MRRSTDLQSGGGPGRRRPKRSEDTAPAHPSPGSGNRKPSAPGRRVGRRPRCASVSAARPGARSRFRVGGHYKCGDRPTSKRGLGRGGGDRSAARTPPRPNPRLEAGIGNRPPRGGGSGGHRAPFGRPPPGRPTRGPAAAVSPLRGASGSAGPLQSARSSRLRPSALPRGCLMPELRRSLSPSLVRLARAGAADAELLARFVRSRDESAFAALVERHGPMVLGVCRRALGDIHTADDAFQATFLALARNAGRVREPGARAAWLYGAAGRVARTARRTATRAGAAVRRAPRRATADPLTEITGRELVAVVDEELARLPEPLRAPVLLCCIDGLSQDEAARRLGWSPGSVRGRLTRGRERLRQRLARRGIALSSGLALCSVSRAGAVPPAELTGQSVRVAVSDVAPPAVAELAKAAARYAYLPKLAAIALLSLATVGIASFGGGDPAPPPISKPSPGTELVTVPPRLVDQFGDPLPTGAVARLGSARWRHEGEAKAMAFAPDGRSLAVLSGNDGAVSFFATDTGKLSHRLRGPGILNLAYAPDGSVLAAQNGKADVDLYDAKTKQLVRTLKIPGQPAPFGEHFQICCFSSDGKRVAANSGSATIAVWDPARAEAVATITGHNHSNPGIVFTADGTGLLVAAGNPVVHLYDARTGKFVRGFNPDQRAAFSLAVSNDGKVLASGGRDRIALTEFETGKELGRLDAKMGAVLDMGFTPDGKTLVSGAEDGKVRVWDVATHKARFVLDGRGWIGRSMALSNDGTTVALGGVYNVIRLWDVATGKERFDLPDGHDAPVHAVAFSPDGRLLVTGGENQQTRLWDPATGRVVRRLQASSGQVSLSPDGRQLVSAWMFNPKVRVWDVDRGAEVKALTHEGGEVQVPNAAFTADGRSILSVSWRRSDDASSILKTWDRETGKSRQSLELPGLRWPRSFAVSPAG